MKNRIYPLNKEQLKLISGGVFPGGGVVNFPGPNFPNPAPANPQPFPPFPQPNPEPDSASNK